MASGKLLTELTPRSCIPLLDALRCKVGQHGIPGSYASVVVPGDFRIRPELSLSPDYALFEERFQQGGKRLIVVIAQREALHALPETVAVLLLRLFLPVIRRGQPRERKSAVLSKARVERRSCRRRLLPGSAELVASCPLDSLSPLRRACKIAIFCFPERADAATRSPSSASLPPRRSPSASVSRRRVSAVKSAGTEYVASSCPALST